MIISTYYVRHTRLKIINDNGQMINWFVYISGDYKIFQFCRIKTYFTANKVGECHNLVWIFKTNHFLILPLRLFTFISLAFVNKFTEIFFVYFNSLRLMPQLAVSG